MGLNIKSALPSRSLASLVGVTSSREAGLSTHGSPTPSNVISIKISELGAKEAILPCRIRLAFVIDIIGAWNLGGTEKQLAHLVSILDRRLFDPTIFVLQRTLAAEESNVGCPVILVNQSERHSRLRGFLNLRSALKAFDPQIVQTFFIDGTFYGTIAAWLNRVPVVIQSRRNAGHWQKPHHTLALRALNHLVDSFQCNSQCVALALQQKERVPCERISVLPNSIDLTRFSPSSPSGRRDMRVRLGLPADAPVFASVATLRPVKGLTTVIESAAHMQKLLPNALFLIVGEGPQRHDLEQLIRQKGLSDTVRLVGGQQDVLPWLAASDIGLLPSLSESSSNSLLEYMAMGLPAVVSDIPANRELVDGEFFPVGNASQLTEKLIHLWRHPSLRSAMAASYREAAIPFGEASLSQRAQGYYLNLASKARTMEKHGAYLGA